MKENKKYINGTKIIDIRGEKFNRLEIIEFDHERYVNDKLKIKNGELKGEPKTHWICKCECGKITRGIYIGSLRKGVTKSCGCYAEEVLSDINSRIRSMSFEDWCISSGHVEYLSIWDYNKNKIKPHEINHKSSKQVWFVCGTCKKEMNMKLSKVVNRGIGCKCCGDGISYPNKFMLNVLNNLSINFETEYSPKWAIDDGGSQRRYDFYIPSKNLIIEMDGGWHYKDNTVSGKTVTQSRTIDTWKDNAARKNKIKVIRIDCNYENLSNRYEYIKDNVINSLNCFMNFENVDFENVNMLSTKSNIVLVCEYWNKKREYETMEDISARFGISTTTARNYLKIGADIGLCKYDKNNNKKIVAKNAYEKCMKKVEVFNKGVSLGVFESARDLDRKSEDIFGIKFNYKIISKVANNKQGSYKGYNFVFSQ